MKIRSRHHNSQGFTLLELLMVIAILGIILGIGIPSLLSIRKPLREGTNTFAAQLSTVRIKAISSNRAYRIRPKFTNTSQYNNSIANAFVVEYASNCSSTTWIPASELDLELSKNIGVSSNLSWNVCFDNRGIAAAPLNITLTDYQANNQAKSVIFNIIRAGSASISTYSSADGSAGRLSWDADPDPNKRRLIF